MFSPILLTNSFHEIDKIVYLIFVLIFQNWKKNTSWTNEKIAFFLDFSKLKNICEKIGEHNVLSQSYLSSHSDFFLTKLKIVPVDQKIHENTDSYFRNWLLDPVSKIIIFIELNKETKVALRAAYLLDNLQCFFFE